MASPYHNAELPQGGGQSEVQTTSGGQQIQSETGGITKDGVANQADDTKKKVFRLAMESKWLEVLDMYKTKKQIQGEKITSSEDTLLHIAVTDDKIDIVRALVDAVSENKILEMRNDMGNTPLHLAAATGKVEMCKCLIKKHSQLIEIRNKEGAETLVELNLIEIGNKEGETPVKLIKIRNKEGETPLFVAALHGKNEVFLYLLSQCPTGKDSEYWRRSDGNSILHVAISGEYFGLAFEMMKKCTKISPEKSRNGSLDLANIRNERGQTPLHVLASNPSAFESGSHLRRLEKFIYHHIVVERLKESSNQIQSDSKEESKSQPRKLPENYGVCLDLFAVSKELLAVAPRLFYFGVPQWLPSWCHTCQSDAENPPNERSAPAGSNEGGGENRQKGQEKSVHKHDPRFPPNYETCYAFFELAMVVLQVIGFGFIRTQRLKEKKKKHTWAAQIMEELVNQASSWEYDAGRTPQVRVSAGLVNLESPPQVLDGDSKVEDKSSKSPEAKDKKEDGGKCDSPLLMAAKMGVKEMVQKILELFPVAVQDVDRDGKNVVLMAVENRQPHVYKLLLEKKFASKDSVFHKVDHEGNSALHLAATLVQNKPWLIPGAALQMQWEIKWYRYVKKSMPRHSFSRLNKKGQTSKEVFTKTHQELVKHGGKWLTNTSQSCSVVAALIATVAFATATAVPGGVREDTGTPTLEGRPAFDLFAITSLIALCFSVTSLTMFLAILTSRYEESDFRRNLPTKVILGLTSLFVSIASVLISFCAGHFFVLRNQLKLAAFPVYAVTCMPITLFAAAQFPLYWDLIRSSLTSVPLRTFEVTSL